MKTYTFKYRDRLNTLHTVYIDIADGSGTATINNGDVSPFVIQEDDNDDMLDPIRTKTGYLKVIEPNFGDFDDLYPTSPTSHAIRTTDGFCGYLQPQAFSNKWEAGPRVISIPISSPMNLMMTTKFINVFPNVKYRILDMILQTLFIMQYDKIVLPRGTGEGNGVIFSYVSSLTICPFADNQPYQYPTSGSIYAPKYISDVLEAICTRFGLILHDHCLGNPAIDDGMLVLTKNNYDGPYQLWTQDDLDQENIPSDLSVTGNTVRNFLDYFEIVRDNNTDSFILPYSKITYNSEGEQAEDQPIHPERSKYTGRVIYSQPYDHCMLQPIGDWLISQKLSTTAITNAVALCGIYNVNEEKEKDAKEYILTAMPYGTAQNYEMFRVRMIGVPPRNYYITGIVKVYANNTYSPSSEQGRFGLAIKYGSYYWDWSEDEMGWMLNPPEKILYVSPSNEDGSFETTYAYEPPVDIYADYYELIFYYDAAHDIYNRTKIFGDITMRTNHSEENHKYETQNPNKPEVIEGSSGSISEADVDLLFSLNYNTNYMEHIGGSLPYKSEYLLYPQKKRKVTVKRTGIFDYTNYLCKWDFGDGFTWRLIAVSDDIANCERTLTFIGSTHI